MYTIENKVEVVKGMIYRTNMFLFSTLSYKDIEVVVDLKSEWDYSTPIAFKISKIYKLDSIHTAELIIGEIKEHKVGASIFDKIEIGGRGFINFSLSTEALLKNLAYIVGGGRK